MLCFQASHMKIRLLLCLYLIILQNYLIALPQPNDPEYAWMDDLIEKDFLHFKDGIFLESIDATEAAWNDQYLRRLKVTNNQVTGGAGTQPGYQMLCYLAINYGLPDLDILYYEEDGIRDYKEGGAPIFCSSKVKTIKQALYFADWYTIMPNPRCYDIIKRIDRILEEVKWEDKKNQLIWRGRTTDGSYYSDNWQTAGRRGRLVNLSLSYPDLIDASFIYADWLWVDVKKNRPKDFLTHEEQVIYKYQIVLDGIFTTYPGDRWRLFSNSVVFMHESDKGHWFYEALIPWVHYVPVKSDLSDLIENLAFIMEHDHLAREIATNGRNFAKKNLYAEHIAIYCYKALIKYASLQRKSNDH